MLCCTHYVICLTSCFNIYGNQHNFVCLFTLFPQHRIKDILDSWLKVQAAWLYLEPIFGSEDIRRQIPVEGAMFTTVDGHW